MLNRHNSLSWKNGVREGYSILCFYGNALQPILIIANNCCQTNKSIKCLSWVIFLNHTQKNMVSSDPVFLGTNGWKTYCAECSPPFRNSSCFRRWRPGYLRAWSPCLCNLHKVIPVTMYDRLDSGYCKKRFLFLKISVLLVLAWLQCWFM